MVERICFLGRGGSGKSTVAQNLCQALARRGRRVLLVGNDISLSSTVLLRGEAELSPVLEDYRDRYEVDLNDYVIPTESGVFCMELGSLDPGAGCMARGISLADNMLVSQGILDRLDIDMILYDVSGETPCTGYILPIREKVMDRCIIVTNGSFAAMTTANSILQAVLRAADGSIPVQLLVNNASSMGTREEVACYAQRANIEIVGTVAHARELEHSSLAGRTIFADKPGSAIADYFDQLADDVLAPAFPTRPVPFGRQELLHWLRGWQRRELERLRQQEESHV